MFFADDPLHKNIKSSTSLAVNVARKRLVFLWLTKT